MLENVIIALVVLAILGGAVVYIVRAKKAGVKCIGCSSCKQGGCSCSGGCHKGGH